MWKSAAARTAVRWTADIDKLILAPKVKSGQSGANFVHQRYGMVTTTSLIKSCL